jgi:hypothetical protein
MFPEAEVVWFPFTVTAVPRTVRFPAAEELAEMVAAPVELANSRIPREVIGEELVRTNELNSRTVPALIPGELTLTREVVLEIVKS